MHIPTGLDGQTRAQATCFALQRKASLARELQARCEGPLPRMQRRGSQLTSFLLPPPGDLGPGVHCLDSSSRGEG